MSNLERKYTHKALFATPCDFNPLAVTLKYYAECLDNYFKRFYTIKDLEQELKREDINTVCLKELQDARIAVQNVNYQDVHTSVPFIGASTWGEQIRVKYRH